MTPPPKHEPGSLTPENSSSENMYGLSDEQIEQLFEALEHKDKDQVLAILEPLHAADIANFITMVRGDERIELLSYLLDNFNPEILVELNPDNREDVLNLLGLQKSAAALIELNTDDAINVMEDLSPEEQQALLAAIPEAHRQVLEEGLAFPEDSAGRLLEKNIVTVPEYWNVGQTIDYLRKTQQIPKDFYQIFVTNPKLQPVGALMPSRVMCAPRSALIKELMQPAPITIDANMDQEEVAFLFRQYGLVSAPVVNQEGRMIGEINVNDIVDVIDEEAHEDIMHLGGVSDADFHSSFFETAKRRLPWLVVNLFTALLTSSVIGLFEHNIQRLATLAVLMPIIASMGGNAGIQSLTVAVRAIATRDLSNTNAWRVIFKEIFIGSLNGICLAMIAATLIYFWYDNVMLSAVFAIAIIVTLLIAGFAGTMIPIGLVRIGVDPAVASSVFLTMITDVCAFGMFLGLASYLFI